MVDIYGSTKKVVWVFMQCFIYTVDFCCRHKSRPKRKTNIAAENVFGKDTTILQHTSTASKSPAITTAQYAN
jgi:hypothetical protein